MPGTNQQKLARRCQEVSGAGCARLLEAVRTLPDANALPPPAQKFEIERVETVLRHLNLLEVDEQSVLDRAGDLRSQHSVDDQR